MSVESDLKSHIISSIRPIDVRLKSILSSHRICIADTPDKREQNLSQSSLRTSQNLSQASIFVVELMVPYGKISPVQDINAPMRTVLLPTDVVTSDRFDCVSFIFINWDGVSFQLQIRNSSKCCCNMASGQLLFQMTDRKTDRSTYQPTNQVVKLIDGSISGQTNQLVD